MRTKAAMLAVLALFFAATAVHAEEAAGVGFRGWGPRVGAQSDPDQFLVGAQFDLGDFARNVRWQPSVEVGVGDDKVSLFGNFMVAYYFPVKAAVTPYAGAQVQLWLFDNDGHDCDVNGHHCENGWDDGFNTNIGLDAVGG